MCNLQIELYLFSFYNIIRRKMAIYSLILQLQTRGTISVTWKKTALPVLVCLGLLTLFCSCNSYSDDSLYQAILETDGRASPW